MRHRELMGKIAQEEGTKGKELTVARLSHVFRVAKDVCSKSSDAKKCLAKYFGLAVKEAKAKSRS